MYLVCLRHGSCQQAPMTVLRLHVQVDLQVIRVELLDFHIYIYIYVYIYTHVMIPYCNYHMVVSTLFATTASTETLNVTIPSPSTTKGYTQNRTV